MGGIDTNRDAESVSLSVKQEARTSVQAPVKTEFLEEKPGSEKRLDDEKVSELEKGEDKKADFEKLKKLKNPKAKKKKEGQGFSFSDDTVRERLLAIGLDLYPIDLDRATQEVHSTRRFLSHKFGGNTQSMCPTIRSAKLAEHGMDDFMFPNLSFNPYAPQVPGAPGMYFGYVGEEEEEGDGGWKKVQRVITCLDTNAWLYMGQYKMAVAPPMTVDEWLSQSAKVHDVWVADTLKSHYGRRSRAKIILREQLGRKARMHEVEEALSDKANAFHTTVEKVREALATGRLRLSIWTMKCVGYDVAFQRTIAEEYPKFVAPPANKKKEGDSKTKGRSPGKRKRAEEEEQLDDEDDGDAEVENPTPKMHKEEAKINVSDSGYVPRGTKSRPRHR